MSLSAFDEKIAHVFAGKVVRKDLTKLVKGNAVVPSYVLEYLLGQYCSSDDLAVIDEGVETVRGILTKNFVHRDEAKLVQGIIERSEQHRIIDKVSASLNEKSGTYECDFSNLGIKKVPISPEIVHKNNKLLSGGGVWCIVSISYFLSEEKGTSPWVINTLRPIQLSSCDLQEYIELRQQFSTDEWLDLMMQSIGLNPSEFDRRSKIHQLTRLVPFAENNYNLIELGPKGTGKSHIYGELSPHGILISGGEVTKAKLFVSNTSKRGEIGLVGYWDVIAYDEFAGKQKKVDLGLVDLLKNYMANKTFSRGTDVLGSTASMVYVGNTDHTVEHMLRNSDLFDALSPAYRQSAFLDRFHSYIPGWELKNLRSEMFTAGYGFIVDYLAEVLKALRREDFTAKYRDFFELDNSVSTRDRDGIIKTYSGLLKVLHPSGVCSEAEAKELFEYAVEGRARVKHQLLKIDNTFDVVNFGFEVKSTGEMVRVVPLEEVNLGYILPHLRKVETAEDLLEPGETQTKTNTNTDLKQILRRFYEVKAKTGQVQIREHQKGVTYRDLFAPYLYGAKKIQVVDPYIRLPYQIRNFCEFLSLVLDVANGENVEVELLTASEPEYLEKVKGDFLTLQDSLSLEGIQLTVKFEENIHDRHIQLDNGWTIVLGRGLDFYQKGSGRFDISEVSQAQRLCKETSVTFVRKEQ